MITLEAQKRTPKEKLETLRKGGSIPAVLYGKKQESTPITLNLKTFAKVLDEAGESTVVTVKVDGHEYPSLIHDVDFDPITDTVRHADFYVFEKGQKMEVSVPVEFTGISPAVKELGGVLVKVLHELAVEADPVNLPHEIIIDISSLATLDSKIVAGDIKLPAGVSLMEKPEEVIVLVTEPEEEKEEVPVDLTAIEVEKKGKEKDGEESAEGDTADSASAEKKD